MTPGVNNPGQPTDPMVASTGPRTSRRASPPKRGWAPFHTPWCRVAAVGLAVLACDTVFAGHVVFGSFALRETAEDYATFVETKLGIEIVIRDYDHRGRRLQRVIATGFASDADARDALARARAVGFDDAWFLAHLPPLAANRDEGKAPANRDEGEAPANRDEGEPTANASERHEVPEPPESPPSTARAPAARAEFVSPGVRGLILNTTGAERDAIVVPGFEKVDIRLDGRLDEDVWAVVNGYDSMVLVEPDTLVPARHRTLTHYLHTEEGLYVGVWNEQPARTLRSAAKRPGAGRAYDGWGITLDTSGAGRYGHWFVVELGAGTPRTAWQSATAELDDGWSLEAFLPWSAMSLPPVAGDRAIGVYVNRRVAYLGERWGWPALVTPGRGG